MRTRFVVMTIAVALACLRSEALAAEGAHIEVSPAKEVGKVNRLVLGTAIPAPKWHLSLDIYNDWGAGVWNPMRRSPAPAFVDAAKEAGIAFLRLGSVLRDWKRQFIGPVEKRPLKFGLPEFLRFSEETGVAPILIVDAVNGTPEGAADLVEYLNAPKDGGNPNGGVDWAAVRARDGHTEPFNVVWFEFGNEFYAGAGEKIRLLGLKGYGDLARYYAQRYLVFRRAMKAVDARIKLGANIQYPIWPWNEPVLRIAGKELDFGIPHIYAPQPSGKSLRTMLQSFAAIGRYVGGCFEALNEHVEKVTGRSDLPWVVTEYNCGGQSKPVAFRFTSANALSVAEYIRVMMQPRHRVIGANFWNFANEMWGIVRGFPHKGEKLRKQPPFYVFELYMEHFGDVLIQSKVSCGDWHFPGGSGIPAAETPDITVNAAKRKDGAVTLMLVNTNFDADVDVTIAIHGWRTPGQRAEAWSLVAPRPSATNLEANAQVQVVKTPVRKTADRWMAALPKHSLTALEIRP